MRSKLCPLYLVVVVHTQRGKSILFINEQAENGVLPTFPFVNNVHEITEELHSELYIVNITSYKQIMLRYATERYWEQLSECGIKDRPDLTAKRRNGEKAAEALATDIVG